MSRYGELRVALQRLHWGSGLTREEMWRQNQTLPRDLLGQLPSGYRFRDASEVMSYFDHLRRHGVSGNDPLVEPVMPPIAWGESPTGRTYGAKDLSHGVGSGATTVRTGASGQTGVDRSGTGAQDEEVTP